MRFVRSICPLKEAKGPFATRVLRPFPFLGNGHVPAFPAPLSSAKQGLGERQRARAEAQVASALSVPYPLPMQLGHFGLKHGNCWLEGSYGGKNQR